MLPCTRLCCPSDARLHPARGLFQTAKITVDQRLAAGEPRTGRVHGWYSLQQQQQQCSPAPGLLSSRPVVATAAAGKGFGSTKSKGAVKSSGKAGRKCPCGSGQPYGSCCSRYHSGSALAQNPEALLRSRFSAYAPQEVDYLVKTTHKQNPEYTGDDKSYARSLKKTAAGVEYVQLTIAGPVAQQDLPQAYLRTMNTSRSSSSSSSIESPSSAAAAAADDDAFLRFSVKWRSREGGPQQLATEISHFKQVEGVWLYYNEVDLARESV